MNGALLFVVSQVLVHCVVRTACAARSLEEARYFDELRRTQRNATSDSITYCDPLHMLFAGFLINHVICDHYCSTRRRYGRGSCRVGRCVCG